MIRICFFAVLFFLLTPSIYAAQDVLFTVASDQVYVSKNGGNQWVGIYVNNAGAIHYNDMCFDAKNRCIYAASTVGVIKSSDGGHAWSKINPGGDERPVNRVNVSLDGDGTLYALTMDGFFHSKDLGKTWGALGLPSRSIFFVAPFAKSRKIYMASSSRLYLSINNGNSWKTVDSNLPGDLTILSMAVNPTKNNELYLATTEGLWFSNNSGQTWHNKTISPKHWIQTIKIEYCEKDPSVMYALDEDTKENGICYMRRSANGGKSWQVIASKDEIRTFAVHPLNAKILYVNGAGRTAVSGIESGFASVSKTADGGNTWKSLQSVMPGYTGIKKFMVRPW